MICRAGDAAGCYDEKGNNMNPILSLVPVVVMFTLIPALYGAYIKLSMRLLRYSGITWKQGFVFGLIIVLCSALMRAAMFGIGVSLPLVPAILIGLVLNWLIGSWYFSSRADIADGGTLGWDKALKLTGLAVLMLGLTGGLLIGIAKIFSK
jgi:hypothetical protein